VQGEYFSNLIVFPSNGRIPRSGKEKH
jgi:hypothetical protein